MINEIEFQKAGRLNSAFLHQYLKECDVLCRRNQIIATHHIYQKVSYQFFRFRPYDNLLYGLPDCFMEYFMGVAVRDGYIVAAVTGGVFHLEPFMSDLSSLSHSSLPSFAYLPLTEMSRYIFPVEEHLTTLEDNDFETILQCGSELLASACIIDSLRISSGAESVPVLLHMVDAILELSDASFFASGIHPVLSDVLSSHLQTSWFESCFLQDGILFACYGRSCNRENFRKIRIFALLKQGYTQTQLLAFGFWPSEIDAVMAEFM